MSTGKKKVLLIDSGDGGKSFIFNLIADENISLYLAVPRIQDWMTGIAKLENLIVCDVYDHTAIEEAVSNFENTQNVTFDGIGTYYDFFVVQAAKLAEKRNLPQNSVEAAMKSSANKFAMRERCKESGIQMPRYQLVDHADTTSLMQAITDFGFPCVVKPIIGSRSFGVKKFESKVEEDDLKELFDLTDEEEKELFKNFKGDFLIEEYMSGMVVSVDGFVQNGQISFAGVIEFVMGPEPHFTQEANYIPPRIPEASATECIEYTKLVIEVLGFDKCGFHCELRITPDGPRLIEIAGRLPGGPLQLGYKQAYGFNLARNLIDIWLGVETSLLKTKSSFIAQKAIYDYRPGVLNTLSGLDAVGAHHAVWASAQITKTGSKIKTYPEVPDPIYFYACEGESAVKRTGYEKEIERLVDYMIE